MGSTICLEHRHNQNEDDVYAILFGGKYDKKKENLQIAFHTDEYYFKKHKRRKRKRKNNHLNK